MTFSSGLLVALFGMAVVFTVLIVLSIFIRLEAVAIGALKGNLIKNNNHRLQAQCTREELFGARLMDSMEGKLKLVNVDEQACAIITAAITHEGRASGRNLVVKSIKLLES